MVGASTPWPAALQPAVEIVVPNGAGEWMRDVAAAAGGLNATIFVTDAAASAGPIDWRAGGDARAPFAAGVANFSALAVAAAGSYVLHVLVADFDVLVSSPFIVTTGYPAGLALVVPPGDSSGGLPLNPPPTVGVVDNGGNVIALGGSGGVVTVDLVGVPASLSGGGSVAPASSSYLRGGPQTTALRADDGLAAFPALVLDAAGAGYVLRFCVNAASVVLPNPCVYSAPFSVRVGPTARLVVTTQPGRALGGQPFASQPVVELRDEGGNLNTQDSHSWVSVGVWVEPVGGARLRPRRLRRLIPVAALTANLTTGSVYVNLSGDPWGALYVGGQRNILPGDSLAFGPPPLPPRHFSPFLTVRDDDDLYVPDQYNFNYNSSSTPNGTASTPANGTFAYPFPPPRAAGVVVASVRPSGERRLRLALPWPGPNMVYAPMAVVTSAVTVPVIAGVATFANLTLDIAGEGYVLAFVSSLVPHSNMAAPAVWSSLHPSGDTAPFGYGTGRTGAGFGFGSDAHSLIPGRIAVASAPFAVGVGLPHELRVRRALGRAWAGNQPFGLQPSVAIVDAGGNTLADRGDDVIVVEGVGMGYAAKR